MSWLGSLIIEWAGCKDLLSVDAAVDHCVFCGCGGCGQWDMGLA